MINSNQTCDNVSDCIAWDEDESACAMINNRSTHIHPIFGRPPMPGVTDSTPTTSKLLFVIYYQQPSRLREGNVFRSVYLFYPVSTLFKG